MIQKQSYNKFTFLGLCILLASLILGLFIYFASFNFNRIIFYNNDSIDTDLNISEEKEINLIDLEKIAEKHNLSLLDSSNVIIDEKYILGDKNAPITIISYNDFTCPFSVRFYDTVIEELKTTYIEEGKVRYVFKTLARGGNAALAGEAILCAGDQNKYWDFHDYLFENSESGYDWVSEDNLNIIAKNLGLNIEEFSNCLYTGQYSNQVSNDVQEAFSLDIMGTPDTLINGINIPGAQPYERIKTVIDDILIEYEN